MATHQVIASRKPPIQLKVEGKLMRIDEVREGAESVIPQPVRPWHGFPIEFHSAKAESREMGALCYPQVLIWYQKRGHTQAKMTSGCYKYESTTSPGEFIVIPEKFEFDRGFCQATNTAGVALEIRPADLNQMFPDEIKTFNLSRFHIIKDKALENLFSLMEMEILNGCPSGKLYSESLSIALVMYLTQTYAYDKPLKRVGNKMAGQSLQTVKSYVRENLGNELSLVELANLVHTSPYHFARLFKASMGMTPHSYVLEQRILEAQRLLKSGRPIAEIATVTGFSSPTHLADVFRRQFGVSPTTFRKQANHS